MGYDSGMPTWGRIAQMVVVVEKLPMIEDLPMLIDPLLEVFEVMDDAVQVVRD